MRNGKRCFDMRRRGWRQCCGEICSMGRRCAHFVKLRLGFDGKLKRGSGGDRQ